jgi:Phage P22-like portal protein
MEQTTLDPMETSKKEEGTLIDTLHIDGTVNASYTPEGFESVEDFLSDMRKEYRSDVDADSDNRTQALDDKKFSVGEQWDSVVKEQRKGLPCLVINSIPQFTAQLVGDWRESRKAIKVVPSNDEDADVAAIRGDLIRSIEMQSRADRVYDAAFESLVQCGDGSFRISVEYARDDVFDQDIFIRPIEDCLSTVWDRFSVDPTGRDAKRVFVDDKIPKAEFERKWPEIAEAPLQDSLDVSLMSTEGWIDDDHYRVTEYWRLIERKKLLAMFSNGKIFELEGDNVDSLIQANGAPIKTRVTWCSYAQMHLCTGFSVLAGPYEYRLNRLPIIRMSGRVTNVGGRRVRYGLVRFMKDAVRLKNFWRSVAAEQLGYAPKAKWIAPESAVEGREDAFRKAHLSRDPLLVYNDGAEAPPQLIPPPPVEASLLNEAATNAQDMKDVTGIHDASLGVRSNETSGRAIQARQREGDIASLTFYDNANAAVLEAGDVVNQLIPQVFDGTRVIRRIGEDEKIKFQRINDPMDPNSIDLSVGMFDVALSTGTSYTTRRVEAAQAMMDAIQVWPQLMTVAGDLVARAQDWPGADKIAERLEEQLQKPQIDPQMVQQMQEQMQKLTMENQQYKLDDSNAKAKLEIDTYNAETLRIRALSDNEVDGNKMEMDAIQMIIDSSTQLDDHDLRRDEFSRNEDLKKSTLAAKSTSQPGNVATKPSL